MRTISIGKAARESGVKVPTIRYYEQIGLLAAPERTESNRRTYTDDDIRRLAFIRHSRELGFEIDAIRTLIELQEHPAAPCAAADAIARRRLEDVQARIRKLRALEQELERMLASGVHGRVHNCRVIEVLADHYKCVHEEH
ncbi:MerR family transcriptional regulator [Sinorhizobium alkalisoli]|uniref:MerR family transcriptional regulator n=1 Tax=Sinorhizobium alkalisoli TaxID=1752398 RepID=A0A1E3VG84_9HYPH|nr:helix-turn-helix domain-containing protein [Sinorhizobium alkalisoli]MCA1493169.1 helix-turn-helix domain-containing protein [Ensifer sp. NBAIM29]MCG5479216.1 helix-turn-helix domain-containing protein [Sinorhizobium alkalisoli]ODR92544.1 MerR family transcriptional regulator [Sinorhizobium alkalisoli]